MLCSCCGCLIRYESKVSGVCIACATMRRISTLKDQTKKSREEILYKLVCEVPIQTALEAINGKGNQ